MPLADAVVYESTLSRKCLPPCLYPLANLLRSYFSLSFFGSNFAPLRFSNENLTVFAVKIIRTISKITLERFRLFGYRAYVKLCIMFSLNYQTSQRRNANFSTKFTP